MPQNAPPTNTYPASVNYESDEVRVDSEPEPTVKTPPNSPSSPQTSPTQSLTSHASPPPLRKTTRAKRLPTWLTDYEHPLPSPDNSSQPEHVTNLVTTPVQPQFHAFLS